MVNKTEQTRTLEEYLSLPYTIRVVPAQPSGYVATVEELQGCITQAETWEQVGEMIHDAMRGWIGAALEDGQPVPEPREEIPPAKVLLRLPRSLHHDLTKAAEREGVSLNQFVVYQLGRALGAYTAIVADNLNLPDHVRNVLVHGPFRVAGAGIAEVSVDQPHKN